MISIFLAKLLGSYMVIVCLAVWLRRKEVAGYASDFFNNRATVVLSGALVLLLGLAMVISHNIWQLNYRGVITLIGWLTILKGMMRLFWPEQVKNWGVKAVNSSWYALPLVAFFFVGVWLAYVGFFS